MSSSSRLAGTLVAGRYRLEAFIDRGACGEVWRADDLGRGSPVAVKLVHLAGLRDDAARARLGREAQAGAALRGPNIVRVLDHGTDDGEAYLVMELLAGESLKTRLTREGVLPPSFVADVIDQASCAVGRAHRMGIIHRDLKPANLFLAAERCGDAATVKVLDFGAVKLATLELEAALATQTGAIIGTPYYMSPEQLRSSKHVDSRTDIWSLGVIAFESITGFRPFVAKSLADLIVRIAGEPPPTPSDLADVPAGFDAWFARASERDRDRRFESAEELAAALRAVTG